MNTSMRAVMTVVMRLGVVAALTWCPACGGGGAARPDAGGPGGADGRASPPAPSFRRGINLGNRLDAPNEGDWGATLHDTDFAQVASRPFDHVRLPVRFSAHAAATPPYGLDETFMKRVDWALDQALSRGLSVVLDLHHYLELHQDPAGHAERFLALWSQIAARYASQPPAVAFELLNEPSDALVSGWNDLAARAIAVVRATNPSRLIVVDAASFAAASSLAQLELPADPNVMASVHTYDPVLFSLQGASAFGAGPAFETVGVVYPGPPATPLAVAPGAAAEPWVASWFADYNGLPAGQNPCGPGAITVEMALVTTYQAVSGHAVYDGEWGVWNRADEASRVRWMREVRRQAEAIGVGWATWDNGTDDRLFDPATGVWEEDLMAALFD